MFLLFGILIGIFLTILIPQRFSKWRKSGSNLSVWSRSTTTDKTPFQTQVPSIANNDGTVVYKNDAIQVSVTTETDPGSYETATLTNGMLNCYRRDPDDAFCVPDVLGNSCMDCNDFEDPPNSGCLASDMSCVNNYANAQGGWAKGPIRTGVLDVVQATVSDGYIGNIDVRVSNASTLDVLGVLATDEFGEFQIPTHWGVVLCETVLPTDGRVPVDISTGGGVHRCL